ncbi:outer membrane protein assembly factor BamE [Halioxenophilus aromaticivorans]|uniref:Outer membrane protein assembly factor BamE n=1 Tax=Halioxenophilus aromaticivorans TaxID=1306992 RepID=A0AAV3U4S2_9ALTE
MQKSIHCCFIILLLGSLSACSALKFPGVYRITIQQGNVVTQEMIDQLKPGMTKRQVRFVLGTPLIDDPFAANRWDYYYSYTNPRAITVNHSLTVYFDEDSLNNVETTDRFKMPANFQASEQQATPSAEPDAA